MAVAKKAYAIFFWLTTLVGETLRLGLPLPGWGPLLGQHGTGSAYPCGGFESLVVLEAMAEPWHAPFASVPTLCLEFGLHRSDQVLLGPWWEGPWLVIFVDGARDGPFWRMGGFSEFL